MGKTIVAVRQSRCFATGRVVIPKKLREAAGLAGPQEVETEVQDDQIEIGAVQPKAWLAREAYFLVVHFAF